MARGTAAPPITTRFSELSRPLVASRCCSSASQTVGTAAVMVTPCPGQCESFSVR